MPVPCSPSWRARRLPTPRVLLDAAVAMPLRISSAVSTAMVLPPSRPVMAAGKRNNMVRRKRRILREAQRTPDRDADGTAMWSLTTLQRAIRRATDGLPQVSTYTIWCVLHEAGFSWQNDRSWCETGSVLRKRTAGVVMVTDADAAAKES